MSTDFSIRPVGAPASIGFVQPSGAAVNNAVPTELPASQSVTVVGASGGTRNDTPTTSDSISRQAFIDQAAASIVFEVVDNRTNQVVQQFPDDAVLRRRAYFHTLDLAKDAPTRLAVTDRKA
ncbi:MAG TPA: hypothetical protein VFH41_03180 [Bradyrhizobium sp.]|nr:hypothetical protein [Bradyrhizobium sp.]